MFIFCLDPYITGVYKVSKKDPRLTAEKPSLLDDPRIQASLRRLRSLGLVAHVEEISDSKLVLLISGKSILNYVIRRVNDAITYPRRSIYYDEENDVLVIKVERD